MTDDQFEKLAQLIKLTADETVETLRGEMATEFQSVRAETAEGFTALRAEMNEGFAGVRAELAEIRSRLDALEIQVKNHAGFAKEIDHLIERVGTIERRLGLN